MRPQRSSGNSESAGPRILNGRTPLSATQPTNGFGFVYPETTRRTYPGSSEEARRADSPFGILPFNEVPTPTWDDRYPSSCSLSNSVTTSPPETRDAPGKPP